MNFIRKILAFVTIVGVSISGVVALEAPVNISANEITESSLSLSWDAIDNAAGYHVYYSENPGVEILTAQKKEFITDIPLKIEGLKPSTEYFIIINGYDDNLEDSEFSQEVSFTTLEASNTELNSAQEFQVSGIEVLAQNQIALSFTSDLENGEDSERIFKVVEKNDELMEYAVEKSEIDNMSANTVIITFFDILPTEVEFKLTVISILDNQGRNIESGIESFENFIIEAEKLNYVYSEEDGGIVIVNEDNTATVIDTSNENQDEGNTDSGFVDLGERTETGSTQQESENSSSEASGNNNNQTTGSTQKENSNNQGNSGSNQETTEGNQGSNNDNVSQVTGTQIDSEDIAIDLLSAGKEAESLPTTGPEHIFMLILALVFGAMSFVFKFKKS